MDIKGEKEHSGLVHEVIKTPLLALEMIDLPLPLRGFDHQITSWLIRDFKRSRTFLLDPGPAAANPTLEKVLDERGVTDIDYILLTHVHLDHAGGVGHLVKKYPGSKIAVPHRGKKHLVDPARLWEGSLKTLGDIALNFGELLSVTEDQFHSGQDEIEGLEIIDTPGHASHHQSFIYTSGEERILLPGEAAGVILGRDMLPKWTKESEKPVPSSPPVPDLSDVLYMYPATPPVFNFDVAIKSLAELMKYDSTIICYSHYGYSRYPMLAMSLHMEQLSLWRDVIKGIMKSCDKMETEVVVNNSLKTLLACDGFLSLFPYFDEDVREKETFFLRSGIKGMMGSLSAKIS